MCEPTRHAPPLPPPPFAPAPTPAPPPNPPHPLPLPAHHASAQVLRRHDGQQPHRPAAQHHHAGPLADLCMVSWLQEGPGPGAKGRPGQGQRQGPGCREAVGRGRGSMGGAPPPPQPALAARSSGTVRNAAAVSGIPCCPAPHPLHPNPSTPPPSRLYASPWVACPCPPPAALTTNSPLAAAGPAVPYGTIPSSNSPPRSAQKKAVERMSPNSTASSLLTSGGICRQGGAGPEGESGRGEGAPRRLCVPGRRGQVGAHVHACMHAHAPACAPGGVQWGRGRRQRWQSRHVVHHGPSR